jgi:hypothetical protein
MNVANSVLLRMAIILKTNEVNLFVSSVLYVFWYHSPNLLDTTYKEWLHNTSSGHFGLAVDSEHTVQFKSFAESKETVRGPTVALSSATLRGISTLR